MTYETISVLFINRTILKLSLLESEVVNRDESSNLWAQVVHFNCVLIYSDDHLYGTPI